jgi:hypothetical protein
VSNTARGEFERAGHHLPIDVELLFQTVTQFVLRA